MSNKNKHKADKPAAPEVKTSLEAELGLEETVIEETEEELVEEIAEETEIAEEEEEEVVEEVEEETEIEAAPVKVETPGTIVKDEHGTPMFKRMTPTRVEAPAKKERTKPSYKAPTKQSAREVSANPALIAFPNDRYGITKDIKTAMIRAASRVAGDQAKKDLVIEVISILSKHIELKFVKDREYRKALEAKYADAE